jgi:hypothetical protein
LAAAAAGAAAGGTAVADMVTRELLQLMVRDWKAGEERKKAWEVVARRARPRRRTRRSGAERVVVGVEAGMARARWKLKCNTGERRWILTCARRVGVGEGIE